MSAAFLCNERALPEPVIPDNTEVICEGVFFTTAAILLAVVEIATPLCGSQ